MDNSTFHNLDILLYPFGMYLHCNKGISLKKATNKDYQRVAYDILKDEYIEFTVEHGYMPDQVDKWYEGSLSELFLDDKFQAFVKEVDEDKE